jgi:hypothetical protein
MSRDLTTLVITEEIRAGDISETFLYNPSQHDTFYNLRKLYLFTVLYIEVSEVSSVSSGARSLIGVTAFYSALKSLIIRAEFVGSKTR